MITLASDFGSPYPAAMKGRIRRLSDAELIDVAHDLPRGDPRAGAFWLRFVLPEFPPAVHCAVVDPGVGTDRDAVAIRAGKHVIVAPDNGLAMPAARALTGVAAMDDPDIYRIDVDEPASATFHGRDVFAPAAARIHDLPEEGRSDRWISTEHLETCSWLERTDEYVDLRLPEPSIGQGIGPETPSTTIVGEILAVDGFGNAITNVPGEHLDGTDMVVVDGVATRVVETFGSVPRGERLLTVGSHGFVECDVRDGRGDERFGVTRGDRVTFVPQ